MSRSRQRAVIALVVTPFLLTGCNALASEWEQKTGGEEPGEAIEVALEAALPDADGIEVSGHKDGFTQVISVEIAYTREELGAEVVHVVAQTICDTVRNADEVNVEIEDAETGERLDVSGYWAEAFPTLELEAAAGEELEIDVADDCPAVLEAP